VHLAIFRITLQLASSLSYNSSTGEFSVTTYKSSDFDSDFSGKSTSDLSEGTNLYYTDTRARNALSVSGDLSYSSTTGEISFTERTDSEVRGLFSASGDLSYNSSTGEFSVTVPAGYNSSDFNTDFSNKSTDDLSEGSTNLYYTDTRARNAVSAAGDLSYDSATGTFSYETPYIEQASQPSNPDPGDEWFDDVNRIYFKYLGGVWTKIAEQNIITTESGDFITDEDGNILEYV